MINFLKALFWAIVLAIAVVWYVDPERRRHGRHKHD